MTTEDLIIELFIRIDDRLRAIKNLKICKLKTWNVRMIVATMLSMLTALGRLSTLAWLSSWLPSICLSTGMACDPISMRLFTFLSLSSAYEPAPLVT